MDKRQQLIDMISDHQEQRYWYDITCIYTARESHAPRTWEEFDQVRHRFFGDGDGEKLLLTPEQAKQLGDVRDFNILTLPNYYGKLVQMGLDPKNVTSWISDKG